MSREHKKFERLILFSEVAKQLSFTRAAQTLAISRGYLSEQIRKLEQDLGKYLFIRSTRNVTLTEEGTQLLAGMNQIKSSILELEREVRHDNDALEGTLRLTAPSQFAQRFVLDICNKFQKIYPAIKVSVDCSYTPYDLAQNDFDLAFRATQSPPQNMVAKKLFDYRHVCCASPRYLAENGMPESVPDLAKHVCLSRTLTAMWQISGHKVEVKGPIAVNDNLILKHHALDDKGLILVPEYLVDREITTGKLIPVLAETQRADFAIYLIHPQLIHQSARLKTFIQFTKQYFDINA
ncbi:MAG: LysR substrate-binding domain-containing protein [Paraglaciecola polaris]|uniref:LysR family transcriptional regulator n=1 Tax=Paraglaciecola polaris TaxID=222814 RepID=UPI00300392C8|tara:strand:- start:425 stop:1306 length:882 start_codon:yes stop_codon:yes gene_type:complete